MDAGSRRRRSSCASLLRQLLPPATMSTFSQSQRDKLSAFWAQHVKHKAGSEGSSVSKRIHEEEQKLILQERQTKGGSRGKRRKPGSDDEQVTVTGDRSQQLSLKSRRRLAFSRFRLMNEFLYTHTSREGAAFMDQQSFRLYHDAYSVIASKWPVRPIDRICDQLKRLFRGRGKGRVLADLGCGSKPLVAESFPQATVHSFDLVSADPRITSADIACLPLPDSVCDAAIFSLSLMGSNIASQIKEASRVLKPHGLLIIAEVTSRFKGHEDRGDKMGRRGESGSGTQEDETVEEDDIDSLESFVDKLSKLGLSMQASENLEPNKYFVLLSFKRTSAPSFKACKLPAIRLKACQYKRR